MSWIENFDLNYTASFYRKTLTNDGMGSFTETNTLIKSVPCALWQGSAGEQFYSDRIHNDSTHTLACEPFTGLDGDDFVVIGSNTYKIDSPDNILGENNLMTIGLTLIK